MRLILLTILMLPIAACGESESVNDSGTTRISHPFLTSLDVALLTDAAVLASTAAPTRLASSPRVYLNAPNITDEEQECFESKLDKLAITKALATHAALANFAHGVDVDYADCRRLGVTEGYKVASSRMRLYQRFECEVKDPDYVLGEDETETPDTADLSQVTGAASDFLALGRAQTCTRRTWQLTADISSQISGTLTEDSGSSTVEKDFSYAERTVMQIGDTNLQPCEETLSDTTWSMDTDCQFVQRTVRSNYVIDGDRQDTEEDYLKLTPATALTYATDDETSVWFSAGTFTVILNDWEGSLAYSAADTAPTYTLSNDIQSITGALTARSDSEGFMPLLPGRR